MMFLNSTMSTLPQWNSSMFIRTKSDSTGYLTQRTKVIQSTKISAYIEDLVRNNALTKTEC